MDPFRVYTSGDRLQHETINKLIAVAKGQHTGAGYIAPLKTTSTDVLMRHNGELGEDDCPQYGVLGISGVAISHEENESEFLAEVVLDGITPTSNSSADDDHSGKFAVALEPIAVGDIGRVRLLGAVQVQIDVVDEAHEFADIKDGDVTQLESSESGSARILYKEAGSGAQWAVVLLGGSGAGESCEETEGLITLSGTGATADTATWSRENDAVPVAIAIETRDHYDETVHKLYHFTRIEKRDSCGNTYDISAETRVTTDTAETCDTTSPSPAFGF